MKLYTPKLTGTCNAHDRTSAALFVSKDRAYQAGERLGLISACVISTYVAARYNRGAIEGYTLSYTRKRASYGRQYVTESDVTNLNL